MHLKSLFGELAAALGFGPQRGAIDRHFLKTGLADGRLRLVDVREPDEFAAGHVPGAVNAPLSRLSPDDLAAASGAVVLMCRSGARARMAQRRAAEWGRTDLLVYSGSMLDWSQAGEPVDRAT